jgi:hypothetical protein
VLQMLILARDFIAKPLDPRVQLDGMLGRIMH